MMKNLSFLLIAICSCTLSYAQDAAGSDSIKAIFAKYISLADSTQELKRRINGVAENVASMNINIEKRFGSNLYAPENIIARRERTIKKTADFIKSAEPLFDQILRTSETEAILQKLTALNNVNDSSLGFSLATDMTRVLDQTLFSNPQSRKGTDKAKFFAIVNNILKSPLTKGLADLVPMGNAVRAVANLAFTTTLYNPKIKVEDLTSALDVKFKYYIVYYDGLEGAYTRYEQGLTSLTTRRDAVRDLLRDYAYNFQETLSETRIPERSDEKYMELLKAFKTSEVAASIERVRNDPKNKTKVGQINYDALVNDSRLILSEVNAVQAKFISDELMSLSNSYFDNLITYNENVKSVIKNLSGNLGSLEKRTQKIRDIDDNISKLKKLKEKGTTLVLLKSALEELLRP